MTGKELTEQVCLLGARTVDQFEQDFQIEHIYSAINRAISEVNRLFPLIETVQILHYPHRPAVYQKGITVHKGGEDTVFHASGIRSLAFAVSGTGKAILAGEGATQPYEFDAWADLAQFKKISVIVDEVLEGYNGGDITLTVSGEGIALIRDVSFYGVLESYEAEQIEPYGEFKRYDLASNAYAGAAFLDFATLPVRFNNADLNSPTDYIIDGSAVYLRTNQTGVYDVRYYRAPKKYNELNLDSELDIDFRLHDLVALRAAYYIYAVADAETAQVCDKEYQRLMGIVMTTLPKVKTRKKFRNVNGW